MNLSTHTTLSRNDSHESCAEIASDDPLDLILRLRRLGDSDKSLEEIQTHFFEEIQTNF